MGTNFYLFFKDKELKEYFPYGSDRYGRWDNGAKLIDEPEFGYLVHVSKRSAGFRPLFEKHENAYNTFVGLQKFCEENVGKVKIFDEYGVEYSFEQFKKEMIAHSHQDRTPMKWVFEPDPIFNENHPSLRTKKCTEEEADLFIPFKHLEYARTEANARKKFNVPLPSWMSHDPHETIEFYEDPDYSFDWTFGDFS